MKLLLLLPALQVVMKVVQLLPDGHRMKKEVDMALDTVSETMTPMHYHLREIIICTYRQVSGTSVPPSPSARIHCTRSQKTNPAGWFLGLKLSGTSLEGCQGSLGHGYPVLSRISSVQCHPTLSCISPSILPVQHHPTSCTIPHPTHPLLSRIPASILHPIPHPILHPACPAPSRPTSHPPGGAQPAEGRASPSCSAPSPILLPSQP